MTSARRLLISAKLGTYIRTLPPEIKRKIRAALDTVVADPLSGKPLRGPLLGLWSARAGRFRVIYRRSSEIIQIVAIGPRRTIYEEAERFARRTPP